MGSWVTAIANQKGGVGKTTTAVNLSACLAEAGKRVLLVDLDPQANATSGLGLRKQPGASMYRSFVEGVPAETFIQSTAIAGLDIIPSEIDLAGCEVEVARGENYLHRLRASLAPVKSSGRYDLILLDCSPSLGILTMNVLAAADSVIIPLQCEYFALEGLSVMTKLIDQLRTSGTNPGLSLEGIVMTMYDMRTNLSQQVVQEVIGHFGENVFETVIPRNVRVSEAPSYGKPVLLYDLKCAGSQAYLKLASEIIQRERLLQAAE